MHARRLPAPSSAIVRTPLRNVGLAVAVWVLIGAAVACADVPREARALYRRLQATGRAEANLERAVSDPLSGKREVHRGRLAVERGGLVSLTFTGTGERVTLRPDGGEWLQPKLEQMLVLGPQQAGAARRWWTALTASDAGDVTARRIAPRVLMLSVAGSNELPADSAKIWLDASGLPAALEVSSGGGPLRYRLYGWRFVTPRGRATFTIKPPAGFRVISMP